LLAARRVDLLEKLRVEFDEIPPGFGSSPAGEY
jgi:hypothetical protein